MLTVRHTLTAAHAHFTSGRFACPVAAIVAAVDDALPAPSSVDWERSPVDARTRLNERGNAIRMAIMKIKYTLGMHRGELLADWAAHKDTTHAQIAGAFTLAIASP